MANLCGQTRPAFSQGLGLPAPVVELTFSLLHGLQGVLASGLAEPKLLGELKHEVLCLALVFRNTPDRRLVGSRGFGCRPFDPCT